MVTHGRARLASDCWPSFVGLDWLPTGSLRKVSALPHPPFPSLLGAIWNFYFPKSDEGVVKLFDWQSFAYGLGVDDLIPMIAMNWYRERRQRFEKPLLRRYHKALADNGVSGYSCEQLSIDYRWSVVGAVALPIWQWD